MVDPFGLLAEKSGLILLKLLKTNLKGKRTGVLIGMESSVGNGVEHTAFAMKFLYSWSSSREYIVILVKEHLQMFF